MRIKRHSVFERDGDGPFCHFGAFYYFNSLSWKAKEGCFICKLLLLLLVQQVCEKFGTRIYGCVLHVDIKDGKIWVQHDGTEDAIADQLVALGVPKQDIVLAYHAPHVRQYTEFAVG